MITIPLVLDAELLQYNIQYWHEWDYQVAPHILVVGATGTGKTYLVRTILGRIGLNIQNGCIFVCGFKGDKDFEFLIDLKNFFRYSACSEGLQLFYNAFLKRQYGEDNNRSFKILLFDEWAGYINFLQKKEADSAKQMLANLLMLGRSYNFHIFISQQRAEAEYFSKARENLNLVIAMGNLSKESASMLGFNKIEMQVVTSRGYGHMLTNGVRLTNICVPVVQNMKKLEFYIRLAVARE